MSSQLLKKISGQLLDQQGNPFAYLPFGITIEFTTYFNADSPGGWIGSAAISATDGGFDLFTSYDLDVSEEVSYRILKDNIPVQSGSVIINNFIVSVQLTDQAYNEMQNPDVEGYITIKGSITLGPSNIKGVPNADTVWVAVYKPAFRPNPSVQIVQTTIDTLGNYCLKVPYRLLAIPGSPGSSSSCCTTTLSSFFIGLVIDSAIVEQSKLMNQVESGCIEVDLHSDNNGIFPFFYTELEYISNAVTVATGFPSTEFYTITTSGDNPESDQVAAATGLDIDMIETLVGAAVIAHDTSDGYTISLNHAYAMSKKWGIDINAWTNLSIPDIFETINNAADNHIALNIGNINNVPLKIESKRADNLIDDLSDNGDSMGSTIGAITGSAEDAKLFLQLNDFYGTLPPEEFWQHVESNLPGQSAKLQKGLQVLSMTGMQPEITKDLMTVLIDQPSAKFLTTYDTTGKWLTFVTNVCEKYGKLCVPQAIIDFAAETGTDPKIEYANKLFSVTNDMFATTVISNKIQSDPEFAALLGEQAVPVRDFLVNNPNFDFRVNNVWDIDPETIPNIAQARSAIAPVQNVMRLTGGKPQAVVALMKDGIRSSADIAAIPQETFTANYATVLNGTSAAQQIYTQATQTALIVTSIQSSVAADIFANPISGVLSNMTGQWITTLNNGPVNAQSPDLISLFGSIDSCSCSDCMSMYSPAAYYTDILSFIQTQIGTPAYNELKRRRPDLLNIDLSCKNSNTPLPYTDLVNEILERKILDAQTNPPSTNPISYQTSLTAAELAAYPEHTIKVGIIPNATYQTDLSYQDVYNIILPDAFYPNTTPFHLALEESRTYFNHLGYSRYELMQQYKPKDYDTVADTEVTINLYNADAEWLSISKSDADIISTTESALPNPLYKYYGFEQPTVGGNDWYDVLFNNNVTGSAPASLRTLLERTNISYKELLQILSIRFLNQVIPEGIEGTFAIVSNHVTQNNQGQYIGEDTCNLDELTLIYREDIPQPPLPPTTPLPQPSPATIENYIMPFLDKLHRFVRLRRATGWSIYQLDIVLMSLQVPNQTIIDVEVLKNVATVHRLSQMLNAAPEKLCSFWSNLDVTHYINYNSDAQNKLPSVYDSLFRNKAIINPNDEAFDDPDFPGSPVSYIGHKGTILAATNITEEELDLLYRFIDPFGFRALSLPNLSKVYALSLFASGMHISVTELLQIFDLYSITNASFAAVATEVIYRLQTIITTRQNLANTPFSLSETNYLLRHQDPLSIYAPVQRTIELFYETLRPDLKKQLDKDIEAQTMNKDTLGNIIIREFSTKFNVEGEIAQALLQGITTVTQVGSDTATATQEALLQIPIYMNPGVVDASLYDILTNNGFINSSVNITPEITLPIEGSPQGSILFEDLYHAYTKASKIAMLINRLGISMSEFTAMLMGDITTVIRDANGNIISTTTSDSLRTYFDFPVLENMPTTPFSNPLPGAVSAFLNLSDWMKLSDRLNLVTDDFIHMLQEIALIPDGPGNLDIFLLNLSKLTTWDTPVLLFLVRDNAPIESNILKVSVSSADNDFLKASLMTQIANIMDSAQRLGLNPQITYPALKANLTLNQSQPIRQAAKAKHTDVQWATVAKPLQDVLREKQRQALVDYMVVRPDIGDTNINSVLRWKDANGLFAYYLIDVEMKPIMLTSRIKQAISTVQLFVLRVIQNIERAGGASTSPITIGVPQIEQWETWRKWYRVWEANRKVFLYPENWMEPTLRDDKTPFFKELETQLKQNEVTSDTAEKTLMAYLEDLDKVAKLEPVSAYHQLERNSNGDIIVDIKHVFGRTNSEPNHYYYRTLQNNIWSPWEKVTIDIKSSHVAPVVWNRRLYLFWLTFTAKQSKKWYPGPTQDPQYRVWTNMIENKNNGVSSNRVLTIEVDDNQDDKQTTWDIKLNWTQYKDGKWLAAEMCKDVMHLEPSQFRLTAAEAASFNAYQPEALKYPYFSALTDNGEQKLADLLKNRLYLHTAFENNSEDKALHLSLIFFSRPDDAGAITLSSFIFPDPVSQPYVHRAWELQYIMLSPLGTHARNMKFEKITEGNQSANHKLKIEKVAPYKDEHFSYFYGWYKSDNGPLYYLRRKYGTGHDPLLNNTPWEYGKFRITKFANATGGNNYDPVATIASNHNINPIPSDYNNYSVIRDYFFYEDDKNTYYVQRNPGPLATALGNLGIAGFSAASGFALESSAASTNALANINLPVSMQAASANYVLGSSSNGYATANNSSTSFTGVANQGGSTPSLQTGTGTQEQQVSLYNYRFWTFYHADIHKFLKTLNKDGVKGLLQLKNQWHTDGMNFGPLNTGHYQPTSLVHSNYPTNNVQFAPDAPYSIYNWEIFFHAPMLIAQQLSDNQQYSDAQKWYHYIFDPTSSTDGLTGLPSGSVKRFWKFYPFYNIATSDPQTLQDLLVALNSIANNNANNSQVAAMQNDPFNPYVIARMRNLAFMKNVVMKYIDNLIAWGDMLFRQNTIESINEATQMYVLAANILGKKPESLPRRTTSTSYTYAELLVATNNNLGPLSNPLVNIESFFGPNAGIPTNIGSTGPGGTVPPPVYGKMFYYCIPSNDILLGYWDTVADRLFKIRNSMNIEGQVQQLPLYEPPIDPALFVRARAMGVDISSIVNALSSSAAGALSNYRFTYILQKANEFCGEVRALGGALLSALEKKDAEGLALLRSSQEINLLDQMTYIKQSQVDEAQAALDAMNLTKEVTQIRYDYYSSRPFTNNYEQQHLQSIQKGLVLQAIQGGLESLAGGLGAIPNIHVQGLSSGTSMLGENFASIARAASATVGVQTAINNNKGAMASTMGGYQRRNDDWRFQADSASKELEQLDKQILGAEIRLDIANRELSNHMLQLSNTQTVDEYMRNKFTNEELYSWMAGQLASTYFKSYQLAYDLAKKADNCYQNELPLSTKYPGGGFITFGYWDSLRKGLLSGENLQFDLRRMEVAYLDDNVRELELTKNISLAMFSPDDLLSLRKDGYCIIKIPEELFDLDYPGHYLRRIKSVSLSIPCIAGPYTTIAATLKLTKAAIRTDLSNTASIIPIALPVAASIATSSAQNDGGVFELNFRDERYLPFECKGAVSEWELRLADNNQVRMFDFETISDIIIQLRYTARDSNIVNNNFKTARINNINGLIAGGSLLPRYFSLKHEFSNEWYAAFNQSVEVEGYDGRPVNLELNIDQFPEYAKGKTVTITDSIFVLRLKENANGTYRLKFGPQLSEILTPNVPLNMDTPTTIEDGAPGNFDFILYKTTGDIAESELADLYFVVNYIVS
ncbi:MAG: neuraminidase-like domain-containing protein [Taibaiella sp.]|jgi:hypothetical protein